MDPFIFNEYKSLLRALVAENKTSRGFLTRLAASAGCQPSFLSQVLHAHAHLTSDHVAGIAEAMEFGDPETDYFLELLQVEKAGSEPLRKACLRRLSKLRADHANLAHRVAAYTGLAPDVQSVIYSAWHWVAIYVLVSIPKYHSPPLIAARLRLGAPLVQATLRSLESFNLIRKSGGRWQLTESNIHLPKDSHLTSVNHLNWRVRAINKIQEVDENAFHYTAVQSLSLADFERLKAMLLEFVRETREIARASPEEEIVCICFDVFKL